MAPKIHNPSLVSNQHRLGGMTVVVTRPRAQGEVTANYLETAGANVIRYPVLDIAPLALAIVEQTCSQHDLQNAHALIFVSANAVQHGLPILKRWGGFPANLTLYAIGKITADTLQNAVNHAATNHKINIITPTSGNDSEALLAMPTLQGVAGQTIILVGGSSATGGRTLLQQTLRARGAVVTLLTCYERKAITVTAAQQALLSTRLESPSAIAFLALSVETLDALMDNLAKLVGWQEATLLVSHPRVAKAAHDRGWRRCEVVPMQNQALVDALVLLKPTLLQRNNSR